MKDGKTTKLLIGETRLRRAAMFTRSSTAIRACSPSTSSNKGSLDKASKDLRDKHLMTFDQDKISRVELNAEEAGLSSSAASSQNEWQILKPKPMRADGFQVEELVRKLNDAQMDTNVSDEDAKKAAAAFASATRWRSPRSPTPTARRRWKSARSKDDYYAKSSVVEGVYKVTKDLGEGLDKSLDDFRNKKVFDFGFNDPTRIEIKDGAKTATYEKSGDKWMSGGKTMDSTSVQALIDKLRDLAATKFVDSGFTTPLIELTVVSNDGKRTEKVQIAPAGDELHRAARRRTVAV